MSIIIPSYQAKSHEYNKIHNLVSKCKYLDVGVIFNKIKQSK